MNILEYTDRGVINPYIDRELYTTIVLSPSNLNNMIYQNLKKKLEKQVIGKCFREYGYIMKVYEILEFADPEIWTSDSTASVHFDVTFSCHLCIPQEMESIICKINDITEVMLTAKNGPIFVIIPITPELINSKIFYTDTYKQLIYKDENKQNQILKKNDYVKIRILRTKFNHNSPSIDSMGYLIDVANAEEKDMFYNNMYNSLENVLI